MSKIKEEDLDKKLKNIQKQIDAIEKTRDLALDKIRKRIETRQIQVVFDSLK